MLAAGGRLGAGEIRCEECLAEVLQLITEGKALETHMRPGR
jgi:hypothetical protein